MISGFKYPRHHPIAPGLGHKFLNTVDLAKRRVRSQVSIPSVLLFRPSRSVDIHTIEHCRPYFYLQILVFNILMRTLPAATLGDCANVLILQSPGRWFATHLLKMVLAYIITLTYDIESLNKRPSNDIHGDINIPSRSAMIKVRRRKACEGGACWRCSR